MKITLFPSCLVDLFWPDVTNATTAVLEKIGARVRLPRRRPCCGQIAYNAGDVARARAMARVWWRQFGQSRYVVSPSGSCVAMIREHYRELLGLKSGAPTSHPALGGVTIMELCEFLVDHGHHERLQASFHGRLVYHPACHYLRGPLPAEAPVHCLEGVRGLSLIFPDEPERCCGFGGVFSLQFPEMSGLLGLQKLYSAPADVDGWVSTEIGCLWHLSSLNRNQKRKFRFYHVAEVLAHDTS